MLGKEKRKITESRARVPGVGGSRLKALGKVLAKSCAFTVRRRGTGQINVQRSSRIRENHVALTEEGVVRTKVPRAQWLIALLRREHGLRWMKNQQRSHQRNGYRTPAQLTIQHPIARIFKILLGFKYRSRLRTEAP